jgi:phosphoglycolate phosphatase
MIRNVVWDWNGTLLDDVEACVASLNVLLRERGMPAVAPAEYRAAFGFPVKQYYVHLGFDFAVEDWTALAARYHALFIERSVDCSVRPGTFRALSRLRDAGRRLSLLSACRTDLLSNMVCEQGVDSWFDGLFGLSDYFAESKSAAGRRMLETLYYAPAETVLVGDTTHDREVAAELGCGCILVSGGHQSREKLERCGCPVVDSVEAAAALALA